MCVTNALVESKLACMSKSAPWIILLFVTLMASGVFAVIKYMGEYVTPVELLLIRFLPASILSAILIIAFYRRQFTRIFPKTWWYFLPREAVAVLGFHLTLIYSESVLPAGISALIVGTWPVMTMFLASPTLGEKITPWKLLGALIAFGGVAAIVLIGAADEAGALEIPTSVWIRYSLILLIAPLSAAIVTIITRWFLSIRKDEEPADAFLFSLMCRVPAGFYVVIVYLLFRDPGSLTDKLADVPALFWVLAALISIYLSLFSFWLWNWCIQKLPAANVSSFSYVQTAFALVIAFIFLGEEINLLKILGGAAIIAGVMLANFERWKKDRVAEVSEQVRIS